MQMIFCGNGFILVGMNDNDLYFWGMRFMENKWIQSESGDKMDIEGSNWRYKRNFSGSMSIGSVDSVELFLG